MKKETITRMEVDELGNVGVLTITRYRDGKQVVGEQRHRKVLQPSDDTSDEPEAVRRVTEAVWTPEVIAAKLARKP